MSAAQVRWEGENSRRECLMSACQETPIMLRPQWVGSTQLKADGEVLWPRNSIAAALRQERVCYSSLGTHNRELWGDLMYGPGKTGRQPMLKGPGDHKEKRGMLPPSVLGSFWPLCKFPLRHLRFFEIIIHSGTIWLMPASLREQELWPSCAALQRHVTAMQGSCGGGVDGQRLGCWETWVALGTGCELNCVPKKICSNPNPWYLWMWPYL